MSNRTIEAIIRLSAKLGPMAAFGQLGAKLTDVNNKAANFNRTQTMVARSANAAGLALMRYAAPAALAYGAKAAVVEFANIERTLTRIGINADASRAQMAGVYTELQQLAQSTATPVENIVAGLDSLIASGKSLEEAMALIGSVSATAQAAGADFGQMATTADAVSNSFGIAGESMQSAFDILALGGKAGKFELRDMAAELPSLAPAFAALGYAGEDGLKRLTAALQTVRMETGTSGEAATSFMDVITKMNSVTVSNNFAKQFGIDIREEMERAKAAGEDTLEAFIRLSKEAVNGDMSKLPLLFTDKQMQIGMRALINNTEELRDLYGELGSAAGTVAKDLARVTDDAQASIDRMANSWERFKTSFGEKLAPGATSVLDSLTDGTERKTAMDRQLEKEGKGFLAREAWYMANSPLIAGGDQSAAAYRSKAWQGGYRTDEDRKMIAGYGAYGESRSAAPAFRMPSGAMPSAGPIVTLRDGTVLAAAAQGGAAVPLPKARPNQTDMAIEASDAARMAAARGMRREGMSPLGGMLPSASGSFGAISVRPGETVGEMQGLLARLEEAGSQSATEIARGGEDAATAVRASGDDIARGGQDAAAAIRDAGASLASQIRAAISGAFGAGSSPAVSGNRGRTMPAAGQAGRAQ
ncbi:phage tail tape measure protein, TP901 family, core region [Hoeflea phototrophica DFL-43]|uniref:Phage tail tape measure protein, TP901 family, core region n=1 Tax=Hoeflea phototrophica (strain DSM 17068 / NCIMB 14078 / DFL-43) TaxID=411684 RepID=A9D4S9_HOEPD|nr:phage tail tape measure protein [Hoeflea phototrophica]EDQ33952.1 phage tail tape measure protein, TP901 family, core region [Hoeflea phototrophica DFL-43]